MTRGTLITFVTAVLMLVGAQAEARTCKGDASGWGVASVEIDSDMNGILGSSGYSEGTDKCLGRFTASNAGEIADWDGVSYCDFDEYGTPSGATLFYLSISQVVRYRSGDLVFLELDDSRPSWYCYHWADPNTSTYEVNSVITGGTGRLEGISGRSSATGRSYGLQNMSASSGIFVGEVDLPDRPKKHDD